MPRLILLNGPPGVGKSTIALLYAQGHPLALNLDIDLVCRQLGGGRAIPRSPACQQVAAETEVPFHEVVLMAGRDEAVRRFEQRTRAAREPTHIEAWQMTETQGGLDDVGAMYDRLLTLLEQRPAAVVVDTILDDPSATYAQVLDILDGRNP